MKASECIKTAIGILEETGMVARGCYWKPIPNIDDWCVYDTYCAVGALSMAASDSETAYPMQLLPDDEVVEVSRLIDPLERYNDTHSSAETIAKLYELLNLAYEKEAQQ